MSYTLCSSVTTPETAMEVSMQLSRWYRIIFTLRDAIVALGRS